MKMKSVAGEAREIGRAADLIRLGARLQLLESETKLSRERLLRLYKEIVGKSPPKGMLPFSTDWFMTWQPNIHASLFMNIYRYLDKTSALDEVEALTRAYRLYREQIGRLDMPEALSITRAWRLTKFFEADMLALAPCRKCRGHFVVHAYDLTEQYVCGLCHMPSRAGKTRAAGAFRTDAQAPVAH
ncbi:MAG: flagellar transcriptional regulator FlhC [Betaproteobacteria bacterium]|jgi:flagellar transcriptional activator FlhC|nr:flagellar transcriptional regulator FlhC [Betaproteobacteria bacterium]